MVQNVYDTRPLKRFEPIFTLSFTRDWERMNYHPIQNTWKVFWLLCCFQYFNRWSIANKQQCSISFEICAYFFLEFVRLYCLANQLRQTYPGSIKSRFKVSILIGNSLHFKNNNNKNRLEILDSNTNSRS